MDKNLTVLFFGQLAEVTGTNSVNLPDTCDTDTAKKKILKLYPLLKHYTYLTALDKKIIVDNKALNDNQTLAFMPPFSGG
jgi:molybdopterin synthase sulfur carrier subunit